MPTLLTTMPVVLLTINRLRWIIIGLCMCMCIFSPSQATSVTKPKIWIHYQFNYNNTLKWNNTYLNDSPQFKKWDYLLFHLNLFVFKTFLLLGILRTWLKNFSKVGGFACLPLLMVETLLKFWSTFRSYSFILMVFCLFSFCLKLKLFFRP